jgi:hypothetical protein
MKSRIIKIILAVIGVIILSIGVFFAVEELSHYKGCIDIPCF